MSASPSPVPDGVLVLRSRVLQAVRGFFVDRGFTEVETPLRIPAPPPELHIDAEPSGDSYLRTSPELHLKRLLASGYDRLFEMGPCFRMGERGVRHNPEYTMLEWYRRGADYMGMLDDTVALALHLARAVKGTAPLTFRGTRVDLAPPWECLAVSDAFQRYARWDPTTDFDADRFDVDLVGLVEPAFPRDRPVVLKDYPVQMASLARCREGARPVAERWELYIGGMELANAFSELTDAGEQERRFAEWRRRRTDLGKDPYPIDRPFLSALASLPDCGGVALGIDRLVMLLADIGTVADTRAFCY